MTISLKSQYQNKFIFVQISNQSTVLQNIVDYRVTQITYIINIKQLNSIHFAMGNEQCNECKQTKIQNHAYGSYEIQQTSQHQFAIVQKLVQGDERLKKIVQKQLQVRQAINSLHVVRLYRFMIVDTNYGFKTIMEYEYLPKWLKHRVQQLKHKGQCFSERQIFAIIYGVEQGLQQLYKNGIKHCCINMNTILCKNNIYKITDVSSTTYITSYDLVSKGDRQQFLSEKILSNIFSKSLNPTYQLKDDLFSLGMIALCLSSNRQCQYFYHWNQKGHGILKIKNIQNCLKEIQKIYSSKLIKKIKSLIYDIQQESQSDDSNLTDNLIELDQQYTRVMKRANYFSKTKKTSTQTKLCTPQPVQCKMRSFRDSPFHQ